ILAARRQTQSVEGAPMIEVTCQTCGTKAGVQSLLAAAQQPCGRCGQLLMGALERGSRTVRPPEFAEDAAPPAWPDAPGRDNPAALWVGIFLGAVAGVALVVAVHKLGPVLPLHVRGAVLGALTGVILTP